MSLTIKFAELIFVLSKLHKLKVKAAGQNVKVSHKWTAIVTVLSFTLSVLISMLTSGAEQMGVAAAIVVLLLIILLSIVFDIIGMAVSTASEEPFHAMSAKKINGARESVVIIRAAQQISSLCNDVIGDIAGIISGAMTTAIVVSLCTMFDFNSTLLSLIFAGLVAATMIGGKAMGKGFAMKNNNSIVFVIGRLVCALKRIIPFCGTRKNKKKGKRQV